MNKFLRVVFVLAAFLLVTGCASLSENQCQSGDWYGIGLADGNQGASLSKLDKHRKACGEYAIQLDGNAWRQGRDQGLKSYCRAFNGYQLGRHGSSYNNVCPDSLVTDFNRAYNYGFKINQLGGDLVEIEKLRVLEEDAVLDETLSKDDRKHHLQVLKQLEIDIETAMAQIDNMESRNPYSR